MEALTRTSNHYTRVLAAMPSFLAARRVFVCSGATQRWFSAGTGPVYALLYVRSMGRPYLGEGKGMLARDPTSDKIRRELLATHVICTSVVRATRFQRAQTDVMNQGGG